MCSDCGKCAFVQLWSEQLLVLIAWLRGFEAAVVLYVFNFSTAKPLIFLLVIQKIFGVGMECRLM